MGILAGIILAVIILVGGVILVQRRTSLSGRAAGSNSTNSGKVDVKTSFVFAAPVEATANGREKIRVTVIALSADAVPLGNIPIVLQIDPTSASVSPSSQQTDSEGKANFDMVSVTPGQITIEAIAASNKLKQSVRVEFK